MFHSDIELKEGAFIIGDAHCSYLRPELLEFLKAIHTKKLCPSQLIFMGDIFDTLFGNVPFTHKVNSEAITIINDISQEIEVVYLEGNHDFNLFTIFPHVKIFGIKVQPVAVKYKGKRVLLAHGDFDNTFAYKIYTAIIRNSFVLNILNILDSISGHFIMKRLDEYLSNKDDCKKFRGFRDYIKKRLTIKYSCEYFIEGHFHQNKILEFKDFTYINLAAFACNQRYFIVKSLKDVRLLEESIFSV